MTETESETECESVAESESECESVAESVDMTDAALRLAIKHQGGACSLLDALARPRGPQ